MNVPTDIRYTNHDEWVRVEDETITIGLTDYAQDALGELVHVEFPDVGDTIDRGDPVCEVESVKAASELFAPCTGEVVEVNTDLEDDFDVLKADATGAGWMIKIKAADPSQLDRLMTEAEYAEFVKSEE